MNIELKYGFKHNLIAVLIACLTLMLGAVGISYRIGGLVMLPLISAFLAFLMCIEKKRILSVAVSLILIIGELVRSTTDYYTLTSLASVGVAIVIAFHYLKQKEKHESALFTTLIVAVLIVVSAALYIFGTTDVSSLSEAYEYFLSAYNSFKENTIASILNTYGNAGVDSAMLSKEYMNTVFDAYLNCIVAFVSILAFFLTGLSHKIFSGLTKRYQKNPEPWHFIPGTAFAYFYVIVAILSMFTTDPTSVIDVSVANLYLIFMFVFAYAGFSFVTFALNQRRKRSLFTPVAIIILTVLFSSFAIQILAVIGAFATIYRAKLIKNDNKSI